jgi:hypothetical protein
MYALSRVPAARSDSLSSHGPDGEYINDMDGLKLPLSDVDCALRTGDARSASTAKRLGG